MSSKMLIDASHEEETRVVITKGNKIEDFDFESEHKKQIRGNIYLAKVTRVEPSLQAAFVEYGGNRHGFLAFSEIHPDYYQIPVADREALLREYQRELEDEDDDAPVEADEAEEEEAPKAKRRSRRGGRSRKTRASATGGDDAEQPNEPDGTGSETGAGDETSDQSEDDQPSVMEMAVDEDSVSEDAPNDSEAATETEKPKRRTTRRKKAPVTAEPDAAEAADQATAATPTEQSEEEPPAKPKRRSRRKKVEEPEAASEPDVAAEPTANVEDATEEAPKPKRRSTRRKKADAAEATTSDTDGAAEAVSQPTADDLALNEAEGGDAQEKPKRKRTSRRKKDQDVSSDVAEASDVEAKQAPDTEEADPAPEDSATGDDDAVEETGAEDALDEAAPRRQRAPRKHYKIQEVIKRRQILLVQVTKEERGNKGAALTTYLSLAGRYSVLMPNTARGGGISRKIAQASDRRRLKEIAKALDVPDGMGVILRTAAAARTEQEVNRDFDYLMRLWDSVRELTLKSSAPALVYEEGNLIKRSIRDLYNKDINEIVVSGERGYREAKDFMKMLMPSQARVVKRWEKRTPLLAAHGVETELDRMLQPNVTLKSGGYIIINQTEALVAIDVNSGRATREHSIEATALQTNLEAAEEVARQLRLRDLAGLIVIDFIDMDEKRNNRAVEKKLKDCLKDDRARIQLGRISSFGLLEMSRQRMRSSVLEATMQVCDHCGGTGYIRSASSISLQVMRAIEEQLRKNPNHDVLARTDTATALYLLNSMRSYLADLEAQNGVNVKVEIDGSLTHQSFQVERGAFVERAAEQRGSVRQEASLMVDDSDDASSDDQGDVEATQDSDDGDSERGRGRRRRGRRGGKGRAGERETDSDAGSESEEVAAGEASSDDEPNEETTSRRPRRSSRRGKADAEEATDAPVTEATEQSAGTDDTEDSPSPRRSTRRRRAPVATAPETNDSEAGTSDDKSTDVADADQSGNASDESEDGAAPRQTTGRSTRRRKAPMPEASQQPVSQGDVETPVEAEQKAEDESERPARRRTSRRKAPVAESSVDEDASIAAIAAANGSDAAPDVIKEDAAVEASAETDGEEGDETKPKRGWWQRGFF